MERFTNRLSEVMTPIAEKMQSMMFISALSKSMQILLPITILGSFACLFAFVDVFGWQTFLAAHQPIQLALEAFSL
jgi:PTS system cellobiose-specific IIC component